MSVTEKSTSPQSPPSYSAPDGQDFKNHVAADPLRCFLEPYRKLGPLFEVVMNGEPAPVIAGPEANEFVEKSPDLWWYEEAFKIFKRASERDPITLDGLVHRIKRRRLNAAFRPAVIRSRNENMRNALRKVIETSEGEQVDLRHFLNMAIFHESCAALDLDLPESVFSDTLLAEKLLLEGVYREVGRDLDDAIERVKDAIRPHLIERYGMRVTDEEGLIPAILRKWDPNSEPELDQEEMVEDVALLFRAGVENTAHLLLWALLLIERHPEWREVVEAEAGGLPDDENASASRCPAIQASVFETERLRPPVPHLPRVAARDFDFAGVQISKGTTLFHAITLVHFLEENYEDPFAFRPSRHSERVPDSQAFGSGPHFCAGAPLARLQGVLSLAEIFGNWRLEYEVEPSLDYVMKDALTPKEDAIPVRFRPA